MLEANVTTQELMANLVENHFDQVRTHEPARIDQSWMAMSTSDFVGLPHEDDVDRTVILLQCQAVLKALNDIVLDRGQFRRKPTLRLKKRGAVFAPNRQ